MNRLGEVQNVGLNDGRQKEQKGGWKEQAPIIYFIKDMLLEHSDASASSGASTFHMRSQL